MGAVAATRIAAYCVSEPFASGLPHVSLVAWLGQVWGDGVYPEPGLATFEGVGTVLILADPGAEGRPLCWAQVLGGAVDGACAEHDWARCCRVGAGHVHDTPCHDTPCMACHGMP